MTDEDEKRAEVSKWFPEMPAFIAEAKQRTSEEGIAGACWFVSPP
jgi:hypothetical protein